VPIADAEVVALQTAVQSGLPREPWPFLQIGQKVRIECGPLYGLEGILTGLKGHHRLVLSVTLLQRSVAVQVEESWLRPIPQHRVCARPPIAHHPNYSTIKNTEEVVATERGQLRP
jgi:hypothetical protein